MTPPDPDTEQLLEQVARSEAGARDRLLARHRPRLRNLVVLRMTGSVAARVDPSDVIQESLAEADRRLEDYLRERPLPFYPWLRQLALERLIDVHRRNVRSQKRTVRREEMSLSLLPDESLEGLARRLAAPGSGPSGPLRREEKQARVRAALARLPEADRELLVLRHLEHLSVKEIAAVLGAGEGAVRVRHVRALDRLRRLLGPGPEEDFS